MAELTTPGTNLDAFAYAFWPLIQPLALSRTTALPGSPTDADTYIVPSDDLANANDVAVYKNGNWVYRTPSEGWRAYVVDDSEFVTFDGTDWVTDAVDDALGYHFGFCYLGTPEAGDLLARLMVVQTVNFPANLSGSEGYVSANPGATFDIDVLDDGSSIGTVSISSGGAFTFTTASGTAKTVAAGSRLDFVAPTPADDDIVDISVTLKGVA